jgi:hypothetical protein
MKPISSYMNWIFFALSPPYALFMLISFLMTDPSNIQIGMYYHITWIIGFFWVFLGYRTIVKKTTRKGYWLTSLILAYVVLMIGLFGSLDFTSVVFTVSISMIAIISGIINATKRYDVT